MTADHGYVAVRREADGTLTYLRARASHPAAMFSARRIAAHERSMPNRPWIWSKHRGTRFDTPELAAATAADPTAWIEPADHI